MRPSTEEGQSQRPQQMARSHANEHVQQVFSSIMTACAFKLLDKHGTLFQFRGTPELSCRDGLFTLKALLNVRRNHDLTWYVGFVDLVKAYGTANHDLRFCILEQYGAPPKFSQRSKQFKLTMYAS